MHAAIETPLQALAGFPWLLLEARVPIPVASAGCRRHGTASRANASIAIGQVLPGRDSEIEGCRVRFERVLIEEQPLLEDTDSYALAERRDYARNDDARDALVEFRVAQGRVVGRLAALHPDDRARTAPAHSPSQIGLPA